MEKENHETWKDNRDAVSPIFEFSATIWDGAQFYKEPSIMYEGAYPNNQKAA